MQKTIVFLFLILLIISGLWSTSRPTVSRGQDLPITVSGRILKGTPDGEPLPNTVTVQLLLVSETGEVILSQDQTVTTDGEVGTFTFENIPQIATASYALSAEYKGIIQTLYQALTIDELLLITQADSLELPLYEITSDPTKVEMSAEGYMFIEFLGIPETSIDADGNINFSELREATLKISLELEVLNQGFYVLYGGTILDDFNQMLPYSLRLDLAIGAYSIGQEVTTTPTQQRFYADNEKVYDTLPVAPYRPHIIRLSYFLPYAQGAILDQIFPFTINKFAVYLPEETVEIYSEQFSRTTDLITDSQRIFWQYSLKTPLAANDNMIFQIAGEPSITVTLPTDTAQPKPSTSSEGEGLPIWIFGIFGLGVVLIGGGIIVVWRQRVAQS